MALSLTLAINLTDMDDSISEMNERDVAHENNERDIKENNERDIKEILHEKAEAIANSIARAIEVQNVTKCIFHHRTKTLNCHGFTGEVECPAIFEVTGDLEARVFGIGFVPELTNVKVEQVRYWLYPRSLDNVTYVNHTTTVDGVVRDIVLYYGDKFVEYGIRVTDIKCYQRLVSLVKGSSSGRVVTLESDLPVKPVVSLIGEVLIYDKEVSKRWLWGYGWGLGGLGSWGWNGLGYGYPYGYGVYGK
jgi:hypothetical protein